MRDEEIHPLAPFDREFGRENRADALLRRGPLRAAGEKPCFGQSTDPKHFAIAARQQSGERRRRTVGIDQFLERCAAIPTEGDQTNKQEAHGALRRPERARGPCESKGERESADRQSDVAPVPEETEARRTAGRDTGEELAIAGEIMQVEAYRQNGKGRPA